jgi:hypothetical protein
MLIVEGLQTDAGYDMKSNLRQIHSMFAQMKTSMGYDPTDKWIWGFFFCDSDKAKLEAVAAHMEQMGYTRFGYRCDRPPLYMLEMQKVEALTPHGLVDREKELKRLAKRLGVASYDGWEINLPSDRMRKMPESWLDLAAMRDSGGTN